MRLTITDTNAQHEVVCNYAGEETVLNPNCILFTDPGFGRRTWASFVHCH